MLIEECIFKLHKCFISQNYRRSYLAITNSQFPAHKTNDELLTKLRRACKNMFSEPSEDDVKDLYLLTMMNKEVNDVGRVKQRGSNKEKRYLSCTCIMYLILIIKTNQKNMCRAVETVAPSKSIKDRIAEMAGKAADDNIMTYINVACNDR